MGDPIVSTQPQPRRRRRQQLALFGFLAALLVLTSFNTAMIFGVAPPTQLTGNSLFSISVQYAYGASPSGSVLLPGDFAEFTLSVQNNARLASQLQIWFEATNPEDGSWTCYDGAASFPGTFTMSLSGQTQPVSPRNTQSPHNCLGSTPVATFSMAPGINTIQGRIDVASTAQVGDSFSLSWFGQPV